MREEDIYILHKLWLLKVISIENKDQLPFLQDNILNKINHSPNPSLELIEESLRYLHEYFNDNDLYFEQLNVSRKKANLQHPLDYGFQSNYQIYLKETNNLSIIRRILLEGSNKLRQDNFFTIPKYDPQKQNPGVCIQCHQKSAIPGTMGLCAECARKSGIKSI